MAGRREFIKNSLITSTGISLGGLTFSTKPASDSLLAKKDVYPLIEVEDEVYRYKPANNGAGPLWCKGSTCLVRIGDKVFVSGLETMDNWALSNNCRWMLFKRNDTGWEKLLTDEEGRNREPSPIAAFHDGRLFLSSNPFIAGTNEQTGGKLKPEIFSFKTSAIHEPFKRLLPGWAGDPKFGEDSYRTLSADGALGELIVFQNPYRDEVKCEWAFYNDAGKWSAQGQLDWPLISKNEKTEPLRLCYPDVMLKNRKVYYLGASDIKEPNKEWKQYKKQLTGREWDYAYRHLFFTWSDDITSGKFHPWIELADRDETAGEVTASDLWVGPDGAVHILWQEKAIDEHLREKFFPAARQSYELNYAIVRKGKVEIRRTLLKSEEGDGKEIPGSARFHVAPGNRLFVVYFVSGSNFSEKKIAENRVVELKAGGVMEEPVTLQLKYPFTKFFTANQRGGSLPSPILDMLGNAPDDKLTVRYARVRLE